MGIQYLPYQLRNGYIQNWLVVGPHATAVSNLDRFSEDDFKGQIAESFYTAEPGIALPPVENGDVTVDQESLRWDYYLCLDDHFVDVSTFHHTCHYLRTWAYVEVESSVEQLVTLELTTNGPADVWLNEQHVHRQMHFEHQIPGRVRFETTLTSGWNRILVRFEGVAVRECPYVMALQFINLSDATIRLPVDSENSELRQEIESLVQIPYFDRDVFVYDDDILLHWPKQTIDSKRDYMVRLLKPPRRTYAQAVRPPKPGETQKLGRAYEFPEQVYEAFITGDPICFHQHAIRVGQKYNLHTLRTRYRSETYGHYAERRIEALKNVASRQDENVFVEVAKMAMGWWSLVRPQVILDTLEGINARADCSDFYMTGLLGMRYRYWDNPAFPAEVKEPLEAAILNFKYWIDEPGSDAMCYWSENHQILFHTCEILAGQCYPDAVFSNTGQTGQWHREKGERLALNWLRKRAVYGFQEWDSNTYFEHDILALSHLMDLAETEAVWEMAAVVLDKLFLTIALNSFKGVFGSTHGRTYTPFIKTGYLEPTSGLSRLMFGTGIFNRHVLGVVSMACNENYQLPSVINQIATELPEEMWSKEKHAGTYEAELDQREGDWEVNKVTYKTPDYMLCSAQDYRPGEAGYQQHIWQATLGPDAVVFVNHPPCLSEEGAHRPNAWHGNVILPRVAQWKDLLFAIHNIPHGDWLQFTHAYFPYYAFDERMLERGWAFGRKGSAYVALKAIQGLTLITSGKNAYRELRSLGTQNAWICQMGREAVDGSFEAFKKQVQMTEPGFNDLTLAYRSIRGDEFSFGWTGDFIVNGETQPLRDFMHYEGPFCVAEWPAQRIALGHGQDMLVLNFDSDGEAVDTE